MRGSREDATGEGQRRELWSGCLSLHTLPAPQSHRSPSSHECTRHHGDAELRSSFRMGLFESHIGLDAAHQTSRQKRTHINALT